MNCIDANMHFYSDWFRSLEDGIEVVRESSCNNFNKKKPLKSHRKAVYYRECYVVSYFVLPRI